ncbi:unnamed protein product [Miscanthus lutarioriparius]|uniref:laccase n=1 Tax=Miscanthus lutarioriparius TaxID=422564 RepID=A0A811P172_9POAL|nr:unnamed protein product [Miscanthus lutarioriparius]
MSKMLPIAAALLFFYGTVALLGAAGSQAAVVEHTFVVKQVYIRHLCNDTLATVVNGQFPGPPVEATEGDTVIVHLVNESPFGITIHWHGVKQRLTCWADGAGMVTQCPIQPNSTFTYRFKVDGQEGTLWWHSHVYILRATLHGIIIIRPKSGSYPFKNQPHMDVPIIISEWWQRDLMKVDRNFSNGGNFDDNPAGSTINGKLGDQYNCSGVVEDNFVLNVERGKTYLLRLVNGALFSEYYFKVAGHKFTVVGADANYITPYTTDVVAIAPGETFDVLMVADAPPCRYYMATLANQPPLPDPQIPVFVSRGIVQYTDIPRADADRCRDQPPQMPEMPNQHDTMTTFYFHGNLSGLPTHPLLPQLRGRVDEHLFISLGKGTICREDKPSCKRGGSDEAIEVAYMNNVSFRLPEKMSLLEARQYGANDMAVQELPTRPPRVFNFTDPALIPVGPGVPLEKLEATRKATTVRRFKHNATVEVVFQSTATMQSDSNPMHLHGHDFFVLAQGHGNYDPAKHVRIYNLVDPLLKNTVQVPRIGWAVVRFVADNPGAWFMHCHFEFHIAMGMATVFEVANGATPEDTLPPPPSDLPKCIHKKE